MQAPEVFPCIGKYRCKVMNRNGVNTLCVYTGDQEEAVYLPVYDILATLCRATTKPELSDIPTRPTTDHCGIIRISDKYLREFMPEITLEDCDTQRQLRARGVFGLIKERLSLPESYTIHFIWSEYVNRGWAILVESPELPDRIGGMSFVEYPELDCVYCRDEDGPHLVEIKVRTQQIVPVKGGFEFLMKSVIGSKQKGGKE